MAETYEQVCARIEQKEREHQAWLAKCEEQRATWQAALDAGGRTVLQQWLEDVLSGRRQLITRPEGEARGPWAIFSEGRLELPAFERFEDALAHLARLAVEFFGQPEHCYEGPAPQTERAWLHLLDSELVHDHIVQVLGAHEALASLSRAREAQRQAA